MTQSILRRYLARAAHSSLTSRKLWKVAAAGAALAVGATTAGATIVATVPDVVQMVSNDVTLDQTESDVQIIAFNERGNGLSCFALTKDVHTDQGMIPKGTLVKSHFIHGDPVTTLLLEGRVRFDTPIIGVISTQPLLDATDAMLGRPGTTYPAPGSEINRGLEAGQADAYQVMPGALVIAVRMEVPPDSFSDQIRVITACDHPGGGQPD